MVLLKGIHHTDGLWINKLDLNQSFLRGCPSSVAPPEGLVEGLLG